MDVYTASLLYWIIISCGGLVICIFIWKRSG